MIQIAIILGSTRPGRNGEAVARWVHEVAARRGDAQFELVDLKDVPLPHLDEVMPASTGQYHQPHTSAWSSKIAPFDAYIFVTPEYNHGPSGVLKNAIDYLYKEWNNKAAGFVGYGANGGTRAVEQLRLIMGGLHVADVSAQVSLSLTSDFEHYSTFRPRPYQEASLHVMLDQVIAWGSALKALRQVPTQIA
ncbi:FMN reductase [Ktedonobacter sp. SOSP1-52]|uniref:NADPH-dependent FMN reductase n=1 Tax=Ktedonobacter sp. SOSP1-52 TaxID=2778366 RepID=UPI0019168F97|nr:NAD(P)H-dependent oxidoreductase [Ktedonobacter sp. SOSP1-52]GHO64239.1 FMN reductase [Ktedonobacter sp. SOSP1-52]